MEKELDITTEYTGSEDAAGEAADIFDEIADMPEEQVDEAPIIKKNGFFERKLVPYVGRNWSWQLAVLVTFIFLILVAVIMSVAPFGPNSFSTIDSMHQYIPFYAELREKLQNGQGLFYSWNIGMGQNFLALATYYLACPINLLIVFFTRQGIYSAFTFFVIFKICFSAGAFGYWLSRRRGGNPSNNWLITAFSIAFALNNYMLGYHWNVMWLDCIMVLPLIILGMERIFRNESPRMYILSFFYAFFCNYYIAFIICVFVVLWFLAHSHRSVGAFFRKTGAFICYSVLAGGMAAVGLVTAFMGIMQTQSAGKGFPEFSWYGDFVKLLKQHFFLTEPIDTQSFDGGLNAYCGTFTVLLFFLYLFNNRISVGERIRKLLLLAFLMFSFNNTVMNFFWHGFHDQYGIPNRFSFVYIFVLLTVAYDALMRLRQTPVWSLAVAGILSLLFYFYCYKAGDPSGIVSGKWMTIITFALISVMFMFLLFRQRGIMKLKVTSVILCCLFSVEILTNAALGYYKLDVASGGYYSEYEADLADATEYIDAKDEMEGTLFSRSDLAMTRMLDEATYMGMHSIGTFCSTVNGQLVRTMGRLGCYEGANEFLFYGGNPVLNMLINLQYTYVHGPDYAGIAGREEPVYDNATVKVYESPRVLPIGYMADGDILSWNPESSDRYTGITNFAKALSGVSAAYIRLSPTIASAGEHCKTWVNDGSPHLINFKRDGSGKKLKVTAIFFVEESGIHVIDTKLSGGKKVRYKLNDVEMGNARYQSQLFDLGELNAGDKVELTVEFNDDASESGTISLYDYLLNEDAYNEIYDTLSDEGLKVTYVRDGKLDGTVTAKKDGILFTSIPYDEGWTAEVDGNKAEIISLGDSFVGLKLTEGTHEIKLRYVSPGFKLGLLASIFCWAIFFLISHVWKKRKKLNLPEYNKAVLPQNDEDAAVVNGADDILPDTEPEEYPDSAPSQYDAGDETHNI